MGIIIIVINAINVIIINIIVIIIIVVNTCKIAILQYCNELSVFDHINKRNLLEKLLLV